jgi:hypothetical protein
MIVALFAGALTDVLVPPRRRGPDATEKMFALRAPLLPYPRWMLISLVTASNEELAEGGKCGHDDADLRGHELPVYLPGGVDLVSLMYSRDADYGHGDDHYRQAKGERQSYLLSPSDSKLPDESNGDK